MLPHFLDRGYRQLSTGRVEFLQHPLSFRINTELRYRINAAQYVESIGISQLFIVCRYFDVAGSSNLVDSS